MAFRHLRTDDPHTPASDSRARLLERLLIRHAAGGFDVLELRRQMGKSGYVPTEHRWEDDGHGEDLTDDDGAVLLIGGMPPADLAAELVDTARQHVEETGERKNYRIVGLRNVEGSPDEDTQDEIFRLLLPATMFGAVPDSSSGSESREHHDALMAANHQLQRQNDMLFRVLMDVVRQYPTILGKSTELLEQLGDQLGGGRQQDLQQVMAILEFESNRDQRWMDHDRDKQRAGHKKDLLGKTFEVAGPDLMVLLRKVIETVMASGTTTPPAGPANSTPPPPSPSEPPRSPYAQRLDQALASVPAAGIARARALLDEDEWRLIEAARQVSDDEEFVALIAKLRERWTARGEPEAQALMTKLLDALGMQAGMALIQLIKESQA